MCIYIIYIYLQICTWSRAQIGRCFSYKAIPSNPKRWVPTGVSRSFQLNKRWLNRSFGHVAPLDGKELYWGSAGSALNAAVDWSICCGHFCGVWDFGTWDMLGFQIGWLSSLVSRLASFVAGNDGMMADSLESICCDQEPLLTFQPGADVQHRKEKVGSAFPWPWAVVASELLRFSQGTSHGSAGVEDVDWDERRTSSLIGY